MGDNPRDLMIAAGQYPKMSEPLWKTRTRQLLADSGMSMKAASKRAGKNETFVRDLLERNREPGIEAFSALAKGFGVTVAQMLEEETRTCRLVGYVGAGAESHFGAADDLPDTVPAPDGATPSTVAVEIRGESLGSLFDRWLVFYDDRREPVTQDLLGRLCIVGLADDRVLVKKLRPGQIKGRYHLLSNFEEPILDVIVDWAAKVIIMAPR